MMTKNTANNNYDEDDDDYTQYIHKKGKQTIYTCINSAIVLSVIGMSLVFMKEEVAAVAAVLDR
jgi:hypothetical protein